MEWNNKPISSASSRCQSGPCSEKIDEKNSVMRLWSATAEGIIQIPNQNSTHQSAVCPKVFKLSFKCQISSNEWLEMCKFGCKQMTEQRYDVNANVSNRIHSRQEQDAVTLLYKICVISTWLRDTTRSHRYGYDVNWSINYWLDDSHSFMLDTFWAVVMRRSTLHGIDHREWLTSPMGHERWTCTTYVGQDCVLDMSNEILRQNIINALMRHVGWFDCLGFGSAVINIVMPHRSLNWFPFSPLQIIFLFTFGWKLTSELFRWRCLTTDTFTCTFAMTFNRYDDCHGISSWNTFPRCVNCERWLMLFSCRIL